MLINITFKKSTPTYSFVSIYHKTTFSLVTRCLAYFWDMPRMFKYCMLTQINLFFNIDLCLQLKYISYINHELLAFKKNVKDDFLTIIKNNIDCSEINGFKENDEYKNEQFKILDGIIEKINNLNEEIVI